MKDGIKLIQEERTRQIIEEGWSSKHDDGHENGEMAIAASCYAMPHDERMMGKRYAIPDQWPWDVEWWKPSPSDRIRELVKAGALIAAEIDRLQRAERPEENKQTQIAHT